MTALPRPSGAVVAAQAQVARDNLARHLPVRLLGDEPTRFIGTSVSADFETDTWTFEMEPGYTVSGGRYVIQLESDAPGTVPAPQPQTATLIPTLELVHRELQACQAVIHLAGGFDPAYVREAQAALRLLNIEIAALKVLATAKDSA